METPFKTIVLMGNSIVKLTVYIQDALIIIYHYLYKVEKVPQHFGTKDKGNYPGIILYLSPSTSFLPTLKQLRK